MKEEKKERTNERRREGKKERRFTWSLDRYNKKEARKGKIKTANTMQHIKKTKHYRYWEGQAQRQTHNQKQKTNTNRRKQGQTVSLLYFSSRHVSLTTFYLKTVFR
jgi:hypothetical protein